MSATKELTHDSERILYSHDESFTTTLSIRVNQRLPGARTEEPIRSQLHQAAIRKGEAMIWNELYAGIDSDALDVLTQLKRGDIATAKAGIERLMKRIPKRPEV